jgi:hypothetical protein
MFAASYFITLISFVNIFYITQFITLFQKTYRSNKVFKPNFQIGREPTALKIVDMFSTDKIFKIKIENQV